MQGEREPVSPESTKQYALYMERLKSAKERYEESLRHKIQYVERLAGMQNIEPSGETEPWWDVFDSSVSDAPNEERRGYYSRAATKWPSFYGTGGYTDEDIQKHIKDARERTGKRILAVDLLGQGRQCIELGADKALATTLFPYRGIHPDVEQINGDALSAGVSNELFNKIRQAKQNGYSFHIAYFRPISAFLEHRSNLYVFRTLYDRLRSLYELMDEGGLMFAACSAGQQHEATLLRKILSVTGNEGVLLPNTPANQIAIRKDSSRCARLPLESEILKKFPDILGQLIELDKI